MTQRSGVACVVPVWNGTRFLLAALDSIAAQTLAPDEVVVVDDGSTDGSGQLAAAHPVVTQVLRREQGGAAAARNTGIAATRAPLLAFLDADDLWLPEKLARQAAVLAARPEADAVLCALETFVEPGTSGLEVPPSLIRPRVAQMAQCLMIRRTAFDTVGGFDETLRQRAEQAWFVEAERCGLGFAVLDEVMARRRLHATNTSRRHAGVVQDSFLEIARRSIHRHREAAG